MRQVQFNSFEEVVISTVVSKRTFIPDKGQIFVQMHVSGVNLAASHMRLEEVFMQRRSRVRRLC